MVKIRNHGARETRLFGRAKILSTFLFLTERKLDFLKIVITRQAGLKIIDYGEKYKRKNTIYVVCELGAVKSISRISVTLTYALFN